MENFSTPRDALVPRLANLLTLAVMLGAVGWSGAHRPVEAQREAVLAAPAVSPEAERTIANPAVLQVSMPPQTPGLQAAPMRQLPAVISQARLPAQPLPDSPMVLQAAGYSTGLRH